MLASVAYRLWLYNGASVHVGPTGDAVVTLTRQGYRQTATFTARRWRQPDQEIIADEEAPWSDGHPET